MPVRPDPSGHRPFIARLLALSNVLLLLLVLGVASADDRQAPSGSSGYVLEATQLGASAALMQGTPNPDLRLHGIAGQSDDSTLRAGALQLEGGFLARLPRADGVFRDGFEPVAQ
jgi:hypothetical protein